MATTRTPDPTAQVEAPYRFYVHAIAPAWRLVRLAGADAPAGLIEDDWRFTRARAAEDTNADVRGRCDDDGFCLFKIGGTFAEVAADVAVAVAVGDTWGAQPTT